MGKVVAIQVSLKYIRMHHLLEQARFLAFEKSILYTEDAEMGFLQNNNLLFWQRFFFRIVRVH